MKILVIEDEKLLADSLQTLLAGKGFDVEVAYDGETGWEYAELGIYDLLILDVMMPGMDGYEVTRKIRSIKCGTPILMLTAKSGLEDRITGLNAGADYYLTKPFDTRELLACINALLRRQGAQVNEITYGNTSLDLSSGSRNLSKETILARVWGYDSDAVENHVEVYVGFLRKKLAGIGSDIRIEAIRRMGYHLEVSRHDKETPP